MAVKVFKNKDKSLEFSIRSNDNWVTIFARNPDRLVSLGSGELTTVKNSLVTKLKSKNELVEYHGVMLYDLLNLTGPHAALAASLEDDGISLYFHEPNVGFYSILNLSFAELENFLSFISNL